MGPASRFDIFFEKHIGFGIRWGAYFYTLELSFSIPFITVVIGLGKKLDSPKDTN